MEEVTAWSAKIPGTHMWILMTFRINYDGETGPTDRSFESAGVGMSPELEAFVGTCAGEVKVDKENFSLVFSSKEDFVRFKLLGIGD